MEYLNLKKDDWVIDATIDGGGHAKAILEKIKNGRLLGIEIDPYLSQGVEKHFEINAGQVTIVNDNFANIEKVVDESGFPRINAILFDFGVSGFHFDESGRGFSFQKDEALDMRLYARSSEAGFNAKDIIASYSENDLTKILKIYGEERFARSIASNIVRARKVKPINTTKDLVEIIERSVPWWYKKQRIHPATKTFQALRISLNRELENIEHGLNGAIKVLNPSGRIVAISFHALEDRIVKQTFRSWASNNLGKILTKKPITPSLAEVELNPRSRSAKLRCFKKY